MFGLIYSKSSVRISLLVFLCDVVLRFILVLLPAVEGIISRNSYSVIFFVLWSVSVNGFLELDLFCLTLRCFSAILLCCTKLEKLITIIYSGNLSFFTENPTWKILSLSVSYMALFNSFLYSIIKDFYCYFFNSSGFPLLFTLVFD